MPPLTLTLKGIAFSSEEEKSVSIIEDETKKENVYHVGDKFKDAQVIRIAQNRITMLRVNGQHETVFLRKDDNELREEKKQTWDHVIRKIEDNYFEIDQKNFVKEIPNIGVLSEELSLITVYTKGNPTGIKIASLPQESLFSSMGLQRGDVIDSINNLKTSDKKNRVEIYDTLSKLKKENGENIELQVTRNSQPIQLTYKLVDLKKDTKRIFKPDAGDKKEEEKKPTLPLSKLQERAKKRRKFAKKHQGEQQNVIDEIRKRLLERMRSRVQDTRIR